MDASEAIKTLEIAKAEVEWEYTLDYALAIDYAIKAIERIEEQKRESALNSLDTLKKFCKNSLCRKCPFADKDQKCVISKISPCDWILNEETKEWKAFKD